MSDTILVAADSVAVVFVDDGIVYLLHSFFRNLMTLYPLVVVIGVYNNTNIKIKSCWCLFERFGKLNHSMNTTITY